MWNMALVGYNQIPTQLKMEDVNLASFREPGGGKKYSLDDNT